jgi:hypothetical protein
VVKFRYIILLASICFSQTENLPSNNITNLGDNWYKTTGWVMIHDDMTIAQAKEKATIRALESIIEYYSGTEINTASLSIVAETNLRMDMDHFSQFTKTMSQGMILEKEILGEDRKIYGQDLIYAVTLKARVGKLKGLSDPFFKIEASLNRKWFQNGDEMIIQIKSTKDCYIYVLNILSDETVNSLLPNQYLTNNFLGKGESLRVPPKEGNITKFRVGLPEGSTQATEMILVLAIKSIEENKQKNFDLYMGNYQMALRDLMKFIMGFPRDQVEQVNLQYVIEEGG